MQAVFNELSFKPLAETNLTAIERINNFVQLLKEIRNLGFRQLKIMNEDSFRNTQIASSYSINDWYQSKEIDIDLKRALAAVLQSPNIPDSLSEEELNEIFDLKATLSDKNTVEVEGLFFAHKANTLCISFLSEPYWDSPFVNIIINNHSEPQKVHHASRVTHITLPQEWGQNRATHKTWALIQNTTFQKVSQLQYPTFDNPLPYTHESDILVQDNADEEVSWTTFREYTETNPLEKRGLIISMANKVAAINQYQLDKDVSNANTSKKKRRMIFRSELRGGRKIYLSVDFETGGFEVCDYQGNHQGEIYFNGSYTKSADNTGRHNIRV